MTFYREIDKAKAQFPTPLGDYIMLNRDGQPALDADLLANFVEFDLANIVRTMTAMMSDGHHNAENLRTDIAPLLDEARSRSEMYRTVRAQWRAHLDALYPSLHA